MTEKNVVVNGLLTKYLSEGKGKTILLLHGWGDDSRTYKVVQRSLSQNYHTVAVDLPGFGSTDAPNEAWNLDLYGDFVARFIKKLGLKVYALVGHSNGGAIAIRAVANGDVHVERLILLSSAGIRDAYKGKKRVLRIAAKLGKVVVAPLPKRAKNRLKKSAYKTIGSDLFVAGHLQETFKNVVTDDVQKDASTIIVPTLLIYGLNDTATPPEYGEAFAKRIKKSHLNVIEGAGHFVHHEAADEVNQMIKMFLEADK